MHSIWSFLISLLVEDLFTTILFTIKNRYYDTKTPSLLYTLGCNDPQINDPSQPGQCCDPNEKDQNKCACSSPQIDDPINIGECCDPNDNDQTKCACIAPQIDDPVNIGLCCNDSGDGATCKGILKQLLHIIL